MRLSVLPLVCAWASFVFACQESATAPPPVVPRSPASPPKVDRVAVTREVGRVLDDFHDAAARADEVRYFGHFAPQGVFLGTDRKEHWDVEAFRAYAYPFFSKGQGWTYRAERRFVDVAPSGDVAWFDEDLVGEKAGPTRGSGVLVRSGGSWMIVQYNLSVTVPNERFGAVREVIDADKLPPLLKTRYFDAYARATTLAKTDLAAAREALSCVLPDAKARPDEDLEFWLHNELTWIRWAEGDLAGALREVDEAGATLTRTTVKKDQVEVLRLHERWDRAYLLLEQAKKSPPAARASAMASAEAAHKAYEEIAVLVDDMGRAVLDAFFHARQGNAAGAAAAAKKVDLEATKDLQDVYVLSLAFDVAGDREAAKKARARVCSGRDYLMKPLLERTMAREGHPCGAQKD